MPDRLSPVTRSFGILLERSVFRPLSGNLRNQVIASLGLVLAIENAVVALWGPNALQLKAATRCACCTSTLLAEVLTSY